jgi:hypothetical protein
MVMDSLTGVSQGPTGDPLSPELVLVSPDLWAEALLRLPTPESFAAARAAAAAPAPVGEPEESTSGSAWHDILGRVEVSAQVPVLLMVALFAVIVMLRVMVLIGGPIVMAVAVMALLGY